MPNETLWQVAMEMADRISDLTHNEALAYKYRERCAKAYWAGVKKREEELEDLIDPSKVEKGV